MGTWYVVVGFLSVALPGRIALEYYDSFFVALGIGLICFFVVYSSLLIYVYKTVKFN